MRDITCSYQSKNRFSALLITSLFVVILHSSASAQKNAIHTMFLESPVPANGTTVVFNAPILRWPFQKGKQSRYELELSQDSAFNGASTITAKGLISAIYNPHQKLSEGVWYWRYRPAGSKWSSRNHFIIHADALPMVSPTADLLLNHIPASHPRILPNHPKSDLKSLATKKDALAIIADAEKALHQKVLTEADAIPAGKGENEQQEKKLNKDAVVALGNSVNEAVLSLCEAYLLTGDKKYLNKGIAFAMETASWDPKGMSGSSDFMDGICMYNMALVFDTFYDDLSISQRSILQAAIKERATSFYNSWINNIESKVLSGHVWQLLLNEFFKTSIALYQHDPAASDWLKYGYEIFLARAPILGGLDGGWSEGVYYFQLNMEALLDIPDKIKNYTGFDFIKAHPWFYNNADWMIYQFPAGSSNDGYGDNTEELFAPPESYEAYAIEMAKLTQNPKYAWYAEKIKQSNHYDLTQEKRIRWFRLTHEHDLKMPLMKDEIKLSSAKTFKEVGVASMHTNVSNPSNDIMVTLRSSPLGAYGHVLADQNTFNVMVDGKRLFFRTGYKVSMDDPHRLGWSKHTKSMNGVLINGAGSPYSAEAYGNISRFLQGSELSYIKGDASNAYQSTETKEDYGVKKYYRHLLLLKPNIIVVYDELESKEDAQWSWLLHSLEAMKIDSVHQIFTASIAHVKGIGKLWSSSPYSWQLTNKFDIPAVNFRNYPGKLTKEYHDNQWHLKAINKEQTSNLRFLAVIQIVRDGGKTLSFKEIKRPDGVTSLTIGGWEIEASLDADHSPLLNIRSLTGQTSFSAYGGKVVYHGKEFTTSSSNSSLLLETINGIIKQYESNEQAVAPLR